MRVLDQTQLEGIVPMTFSDSHLPTLEPYSSETDTISFKTGDTWTAYELSGVLKGLDATYSTLLLARHLAVAANQRNQRRSEEYDRYLHVLERESPHFKMFVHDWFRLMRRAGQRGAPYMFPFGPIAMAPTSDAAPYNLSVETEYYLSHPQEFMPAAHELVIENIKMASPGNFSLRGLGEPLRELRELIKDLSYRNRQERERGDLAILKDKLEIVTQNNLAPAQIQILAITIAEESQDSKALFESGKLALEGEVPKEVEKRTTTRQRKPRRKPRDDGGGR